MAESEGGTIGGGPFISVPAVVIVELRGLIVRIDVQNIAMAWVGLVLVYEAVCREKGLQLRLRTAKQK